MKNEQILVKIGDKSMLMSVDCYRLWQEQEIAHNKLLCEFGALKKQNDQLLVENQELRKQVNRYSQQSLNINNLLNYAK